MFTANALSLKKLLLFFKYTIVLERLTLGTNYSIIENNEYTFSNLKNSFFVVVVSLLLLWQVGKSFEIWNQIFQKLQSFEILQIKNFVIFLGRNLATKNNAAYEGKHREFYYCNRDFYYCNFCPNLRCRICLALVISYYSDEKSLTVLILSRS